MTHIRKTCLALAAFIVFGVGLVIALPNKEKTKPTHRPPIIVDDGSIKVHMDRPLFSQPDSDPDRPYLYYNDMDGKHPERLMFKKGDEVLYDGKFCRGAKSKFTSRIDGEKVAIKRLAWWCSVRYKSVEG